MGRAVLSPFDIGHVQKIICTQEYVHSVSATHSPRKVRSEEVIARNAIRSRAVLGIISSRRVEIGIHSVRGGNIVGDHEIIFAGHDEVITLSHSAYSKEVFAVGAVNAAVFLKGRTPGLYSMSDLIAETDK